MQAWVKSDTSHQVMVEIASDFGFYWQDKQLSATNKQSYHIGLTQPIVGNDLCVIPLFMQ